MTIRLHHSVLLMSLAIAPTQLWGIHQLVDSLKRAQRATVRLDSLDGT